LNTDLTPPVDITTVPPNAAYYLHTNHVWGNNSIPDLLDGINGNQRGQAMSVVVEYSKRGNPDLFVVSTRRRSRERIDGPFPVEGRELSSNTGTCSR
jgi:hypothetical protein